MKDPGVIKKSIILPTRELTLLNDYSQILDKILLSGELLLISTLTLNDTRSVTHITKYG